ncbi:MAG: hypothetical protein KGI54_10470 [Pseudomonadota bacterium]|nr:hypothetical protein [Pseudomonadota bacterium]
MQTFQDSVTQKVYQFNDDVIVAEKSGSYSFKSPFGATLKVPATLQPYTIPAPTNAELLRAAQVTQIASLQTAYKAAVNAPVSYKNAAGVTSTYPAGDTMQINCKTALQNLEECLDAGSSAWTLGVWLDTNNVAQTTTYADLQGLAAAMSAVDTLDWTDLVTKIAEVQAATTVTEVEAITF